MFANGVEMDEPDELSRAASRCNSSSRMISQVYPQAPSPLHFTQLYYPKPTVFTPSPAAQIEPRRRRQGCATLLGPCCCCASVSLTLCSILVVAGAVVGVAALVAWLILRPITAPYYSIDTIEVKEFKAGSSNHTVSAELDYSVTANNPNRRLGFRYDIVAFETSYEGYVFGRSNQSRFYQPHQNVTTFTSGFKVKMLYFPPEYRSVATNLSADVKSGIVPLLLHASAKVRVKVGAITFWAVTVQVNCNFFVTRPKSSLTVANKTCTLSR